MRLTSESGEEFELEELPNQDHKPITQRVYGLVPTPIKKDWPQINDEYWYVDEEGDTNITTYIKDSTYHPPRIEFGNYWRTQEEAEAVAKIYKEINRVVRINSNPDEEDTDVTRLMKLIYEAQNIVKESKG